MRVAAFADVNAFAHAADALLAADEANNTVLLSAIQSAHRALARGEVLPDGWDAAVVFDGDHAAAAARRWRNGWNLSAGPADAWRAFGRWAAQRGGFEMVLGPEASVTAFEHGADCAATTHMDMPLMRLEATPEAPPPVPGSLRRAVADDMPLLQAWHEAFRVEARLNLTAEQVAADVQRPGLLDMRSLWIDAAGRPVGLIGGQTIAPSGARIGPVYVPPSLRGRGIGGAMVTTLARQLQAAGAHCVFLFTDASNPTSNALYRRIGFVQIGRHLQRRLTGVD
jgi:ribosomal protein S18 acetylase RimI-like enzyme